MLIRPNARALTSLSFFSFITSYNFHCIVKWMIPLFSREMVDGVETEYENGLSCLHCLPSCTETRYSISLTRLPLREILQEARNYTRL